MKKQNEQRLEPKLRFKGFSEDWEQCKLGELGKDYSGLTGKTKKDFGHGESLYVPYKNIFNNHIVDVDNLEKVNVSSKQNKVKYGDIFFTISSEVPEEVGMSSVMRKDINNLYLNSFSFGLRPYEKSELDMIFSSYLFRTLTFRKKMYILAQGISRYNISKANVMKLEIALPSVNEQKKIGRLLYKLDSMITLHKRRMNVLQQLKNYYHFKLFNIKKKKRTLYFEKFKEEKWRSLKIADIASVSIGEFVKKTKQDPDYPYPVYNGGTTPTGYYNEFNNLENQIVISARGANAGYCNFVNTKYWAGNSSYSLVLKNNNKNDIKFIYYNMIFNKNRLLGLKQSANIPSVSKKDIENLCVFVPNINEQKYISKVLDEISELIILSKIQIKVINKLKTTYLNNLFI